MRFRILLPCLLALSLVLSIVVTANAKEEPEAGKNYVWIDLGKENKGFLLEQVEGHDGITEADIKADVDCRKLPYPYAGPGNNHMYFKIDDSFIRGGDHEVWIALEYFDEGVQIDCHYDSNGQGPGDGAYRGGREGAFPIFKLENTQTWRFHVWHMEDAKFSNRQNNSADFRLTSLGNAGGGDIWVNRVWVMLLEPPDPFDPDVLFGKAIQPQDKLSVKWGSLKLGL